MPKKGDQILLDVKVLGVQSVSINGAPPQQIPQFQFLPGIVVETYDDKVIGWDGNMYHVVPTKRCARIAEFHQFMESGAWRRH